MRSPLLKSWSLLLVALAVLVACTQQTPQEPAFPLSPAKSPNDDKEYRYIKLDNELRVLLVSDPDSEKAAASLDVYIGSASNPADRGGLAHFLEHMLFLGTDKYPDSGEYARFISEHGGSRNAYTGFEHTNYFFDVDAGHLSEALDRFAQFFISPRFDAEYVSRETNAVHAEFQMGLNTDARRNLDVFRETSNPEHPYSILAVGTAETLADRPGDSVREDLLMFYDQFYSANLMTLTVLGNESLDELEVLVREIFAPVPNRNIEVADITAPLVTPDQLPRMVYIQPLASTRSLMLSWTMPDYRDRYHAKPLVYIGNLIGHEGEGSLLSLLKEEGWAEGLGAGMGLAYRGGAAFNVSINLTEQGLAQRDDVIRKVFEYIRMLEAAGPQRELFDEQGQLAALQFRFREDQQPINYVAGLSNDMHLLAPEDVLQGNFLMTEYDPGLIQQIIENYLVPQNVLITLTAPDVPVDRESEFYGTPYSVETVDLATVSWDDVTVASIDERLHLPAPNEFVAENVEMLPLAEDNPDVPRLTVEEPRMRVWQRQDSKFRVPRGALYASFRTAHVNGTAAEAAASQLYVELLSDAVNEFTYPAYLAGLNFGIGAGDRGITLSVSGYNDKQMVLLSRIVDSITSAELDNGRFDNIRKDLIRSLENVKTARAFQQTVGQARRVLLTGRYPEAELIAELEKITPAQVAAHGEKLWDTSSVNILLNGNYAPTEAAAVQKALAPLTRKSQPAAPPELRLARLAPGDNFVYRADVEHEDSVTFWYIQAGDDGLQNRAMAALTGQAIKADYFEDLRTEQQLGYVVSAFPWPLLDVPAVAMMVQSPSASAAAVVDASRSFLEQQVGEDGISDEQYSRHRAALLRDILQPPKNLFEESDYFWREINRGSFTFDTRERLASTVEAVSFEQWQDWYREAILDQPASLIFVAPGRWDEMPEGKPIESAGEFREAQPFFSRD